MSSVAESGGTRVVRLTGFYTLCTGVFASFSILASVVGVAVNENRAIGGVLAEYDLRLVGGLLAPTPGLLLFSLAHWKRTSAVLAVLRRRLPAAEYRVVQQGGPGGTSKARASGRGLLAASALMLVGGAALGLATGGALGLFGWVLVAFAPGFAAASRWRRNAGAIETLEREWGPRHAQLVRDAEDFCRSDEAAEKREERARTGLAELELLELLAGAPEGHEERVDWFRAVSRSARIGEELERALEVENETTRKHRLAGVRRMANERELTDDDLALGGVVDPRTGEALRLESLG